jgi:two-component system NtrC family sensor kinase
MKIYLPTLLFCFTQVIFLSAQSSWPPAYEIKSDTAYKQVLEKTFWQTLEDKGGKWTLKDVRMSPLSDKFHTKGLKADGIDTTEVHTYWQRYRLKNTMSIDAKIALTSFTEFYDVYILKNDSLAGSFKSGYLRKWDERDGLKSASDGTNGITGSIPLILKPNEEFFIYDRRNRNDISNFPITVRILSTEKLIQERYIDYVDSRTNYYRSIHLQESFVLGLLFLTIFLSFFFFRIVHEKVYLNFALYALFMCINRLWNISYDYTLWEHPAMTKYVEYLGFAWDVIPFFLIHFFRNFLNTKLTHRLWDKLLSIVAIIHPIVGLFMLGWRVYSGDWSSFLLTIQLLLNFIIVPLLLLSTQLFFVRKRKKDIYYLMVGSFPLLLFYIISNSSTFLGQDPLFYTTFFEENFRLLEVICISWLVLSFTLLLTIRFDRLRKENAQQYLDKERLAKEKEMEKNELIEKQKIDLEILVNERTADLKKSIDDLKSAQYQLIQSEKMASLGELTAGIAHEIQNPLNFVNNFSEVNTELIDEMKAEIQNENLSEITTIAETIRENQEKITFHGKRADAIVKGMLQHSRTNSGVKEPTDINALADEYLRLAFHGLRAKDKSFNATMKTDFDESIGLINVIPQDIGRVILNLITNAFYAVNEKQKMLSQIHSPLQTPYPLEGGDEYVPTVSVKTKKPLPLSGGRGLGETNGFIDVSVSDNGPGIPDTIKDKIFQPFFTTKPTGQGTGLGLSLSYDIVKAHGGELKVETKEGQGSTFIIRLPDN